jgi:hypothetical protein
MLIAAPTWPLLGSVLLVLGVYVVLFTKSRRNKRAVLELWTGFLFCLIAYDSWVYVVVFFTWSLLDVFSTNESANKALLFVYLHQVGVQAKSDNWFVTFFMVPFFGCACVRRFQITEPRSLIYKTSSRGVWLQRVPAALHN